MKRMKHVVFSARMNNPTFESFYASYVTSAEEAARKGEQLPVAKGTLYDPLDDWLKGKTKKSALAFQRKAEKDIRQSYDVLKTAEKRVGFQAPRDTWVQYLEGEYQLFAASVASAAQRDIRLLLLSILLRWWGFFHIRFIADKSNIGIVQDIASEVGCEWHRVVF